MKHLFKYFIIISTLLITLSCQEKRNLISNDNEFSYSPSCNIYDSLGIYHNEMLEYHYNRMLPPDTLHPSRARIYYNGKYYVKRSEFDTILSSARYYMQNHGVSASLIDDAINQLINIYSDANMFITINGVDVVDGLEAHSQEFVEVCYDKGLINATEYTFFLDIATAYHNGNYDYIDSVYDSINLCNLQFQNAPQIFASKSIWYYSDIYWDNDLNTIYETTVKKDNYYSKNKILKEYKQNEITDINEGAFIKQADDIAAIAVSVLPEGNWATRLVKGVIPAIASATAQASLDLWRCPVCKKVHCI